MQKADPTPEELNKAFCIELDDYARTVVKLRQRVRDLEAKIKELETS